MVTSSACLKTVSGGTSNAAGNRLRNNRFTSDWNSRHLGGYSTVTGTPPAFFTVAAP